MELAPSPSLRGRPCHGLVSLWDMYQFDVAHWMSLTEYFNRAIDTYDRMEPDKAIHPIREKVHETFRELQTRCEEIDLLTAAELSKEIAAASLKASYNAKQVRDDLVVLKRTIFANMRSVVFMRVSQDYARYIDFLLSDDVAMRFPRASRELNFAGKALAYDMGTASVFHCMRAMESGLKVLGLKLGIPYSPSWESYLRQMEAKFSEDYKKKDADWKNDEAFFKEVAGDLQLVKIVWRNPTMHIVRTYTQGEAREIHNAVAAFISRLSGKVSELPPEPTP